MRFLWPILFLLLPGPVSAGDGYDNYINYLQGRDWPDEHTPVYAEDVQGITHDDAHWFVTKQGAHGTVLYKFHVSESMDDPNATASTTPMVSGLWVHGFEKFKAMDARENPFDGQWYLVIAVEGGAGAGFAVYRSNLTLVGTASASPQSASGWCALDNDGNLYSGENGTSHLNRFSLDWAALASSGTVDIQFDGTIQLTDGSGPLTMTQYQGGDFTPEGDKLYIVTGYFGEPTWLHGIHVFDATNPQSFHRVYKSGQGGMFTYMFNPSCEFGDYTCEEPEGLTFWDLNDGSAPQIRGELHVLLLDNDAPDNDDVYLKHYSEGIWVDAAVAGLPGQNGDPHTPDATVVAGLGRLVDGLELKVKTGSYPETMTIDRPVKIVNPSASGDAVIGQ